LVEIGDMNTKVTTPIIINHLKSEANTKKEDIVDTRNSKPAMPTVVKIVNNNAPATNNNKNLVLPLNTDSVNVRNELISNNLDSKSKSNMPFQNTSNTTDDHNNNQLKLNSNISSNQVNQIARIHSNGSGTFPIPHPREVNKNKNLATSPNPVQNLTASSNMSMSSSITSSVSLAHNNNNQNIHNNSISNKNTITNEYRDSSNQKNFNDNNTTQKSVSSSSIAVIDVKTPPSLKYPLSSPTSPKIQQPKFTNNNDDGVKYKFTSNETIGAKASLNNEFSDINIDVEQSKFWKCSKCNKCSIM
jgi:hypothetical protein